MQKKSGNLQNQYLIWSIVTLCTVADYLLGFLALAHHYLCWSIPHYDNSAAVDKLYQLVISACVVLALLNIPITIAVVLKSKRKDFPVPDLIHYITRHCPCVGVNTSVIQILAVWHVLLALQISCVHTVFVFLAFIAHPLPTAMTIIFYAATVFCLTTTIMLLYASCQFDRYHCKSDSSKKVRKKKLCKNICSGIVQTIVVICFLFTVIFFGFTFLRITVFVGDTESGRISSMVGSLLPTVLIAIFGIAAKKLVDDTTEENDDDNTTEPKGDDVEVQDQNHMP